jgi:hypothetical protein
MAEIVLTIWIVVSILFTAGLGLEFAVTATCVPAGDEAFCDGELLGNYLDNDRDPTPTLQEIMRLIAVLGIGLPTVVITLLAGSYSLIRRVIGSASTRIQRGRESAQETGPG